MLTLVGQGVLASLGEDPDRFAVRGQPLQFPREDVGQSDEARRFPGPFILERRILAQLKFRRAGVNEQIPGVRLPADLCNDLCEWLDGKAREQSESLRFRLGHEHAFLVNGWGRKGQFRSLPQFAKDFQRRPAEVRAGIEVGEQRIQGQELAVGRFDHHELGASQFAWELALVEDDFVEREMRPVSRAVVEEVDCLDTSGSRRGPLHRQAEATQVGVSPVRSVDFWGGWPGHENGPETAIGFNAHARLSAILLGDELQIVGNTFLGWVAISMGAVAGCI